MNKRQMQKWVNALRKGKYKQTKYTLHDKDGFCCLGVLCDLNKKDLTIKKEKGITNTLIRTKYNNEDNELPNQLVQKFNLNASDPTIVINKNKTSLANLNDKGKSFKQIANIIEKHYKEL